MSCRPNQFGENLPIGEVKWNPSSQIVGIAFPALAGGGQSFPHGYTF